MYAHLNEALVKEEDNIDANEQIGLVGSTGLSTGFHLHYEIKKNGEYINPIDYVSYQVADYLK